jgi:hypothetical protein
MVRAIFNRQSLALCLLVSAAALSSAQSFGPEPRWSPYKSGLDSKIADSGTYLIYNRNDWQNFWNKLTGESGDAAPSDVKFGSQMLIVVNGGSLPLGSRVTITNVFRSSPAIVTVRYVERKNRIGQNVPKRLNAYDIVKVDNPGAKIEFVKDEDQTGISASWDPRGDAWSQVYDADSYCYITTPTTAILVDQQGLDTYWQLLTGEQYAPSDVNWNSEQVIAINLGNRPTGGYGIVIDSVSRTEGRGLVVRYRERKPAPGQIVSAGITSPYIMLRVQRVMGRVKFEMLP